MIIPNKLTPLLIPQACYKDYPSDGRQKQVIEERAQLPPVVVGGARDDFWKDIVIGNGPQVNHIIVGRMCLYNAGFPQNPEHFKQMNQRRGKSQVIEMTFEKLSEFELRFNGGTLINYISFHDNASVVKEHIKTTRSKIYGDKAVRVSI